jgi:hypothetical protein
MPAEQAQVRAVSLHILTSQEHLKRTRWTPRLSARPARAFVFAFVVVCGLVLTGCQPHLHDSTLALEAATAPVIDQAAATYRETNALHDIRVNYEIYDRFEKSNPVPADLEVLLSDKDIASRLAVLEGFQVYVKSLCAITSGTNPKELADASENVGSQLTSVANTLAPSIQNVLKISAADSSSSAAISPSVEKGISTAVFALGQFLINRKLKNELPAKIAEMDPHVDALAKLLEDDIDVLKQQTDHDYKRIVNLQILFIRKNTESNRLGPSEQRNEIMKVPDILRQQKAASEKLSSLKAAIALMAKAHHDLTAEAQGKNPESFNAKLQDLANAASDLGSFYSSLPSE